MKIIKFFGILFIGTLVWIAGVFGGYMIYKPKVVTDIQNNENDIGIVQAKAEESSSNDEIQINDNTKIVYEYYYKEDGYIEKIEDLPSFFMIGLNRNEFVEKMKDWQVISFSSSEVVIQKQVEGKGKKKYVIGDFNGYIAVFNDDIKNAENLKEVTQTPISSLPEEEQNKIKDGIEVESQEKLIKCLENYES